MTTKVKTVAGTTEVTDVTKIQSELKPIEKEIVSIEEKANALIIANDDDEKASSDFLSMVKSKADSIEKMREFFVKPLNKQVKSINSMFKPQTEYLEKIEAIIKGKMKAYFLEKEEKRIKEEARLQAIRDKANEKRAEQGKEAIADPIREVAQVKKTVVAGKSSAQFRKEWTCEIIKISELPDDVIKAILMEAYTKGIIKSVVQKFVDAGVREMTGARIFEDVTVAGGRAR